MYHKGRSVAKYNKELSMLHNETKETGIEAVGYFSKAEIIQLAKIFNQKNKSDIRVLSEEYELTGLISKLIKDGKENKNQSPFRIQILFNPRANYWSLHDILVVGAKINMFNMGVLEDGFRMPFALNLVEHIRQISVTGQKMQLKGNSSSLRAFCIAVSLSKLPDLHQQQPNHFGEIDSLDLPAALVKNAESLEFIAEYARKHELESKQPINKKQQSLLQSVESHTLFSPGSKKGFYAHIHHKELAYRHKLFLHYLSSFRGEASTDPEILKQRMKMMIEYMSILEDGEVKMEDSKMERLKTLIEAGIHPDIQSKQNDGNITALHVAIINGKQEFAQWLIEKGANVNLCCAERNKTPLHLAVRGGSLEMVKLLVEHRADINAQDSFTWTPADHAVIKNNWAILEWLIDQKAVFSADRLECIHEKAPKELVQKIDRLIRENSKKCSVS